MWPSAYASGWVVKTYKARGGRYAGQGRKESTGLTKWFGESWVDLSRPTADGSYEPCGRKRSDAPFDAAHYPKCRPLREALRMTPDEVADAVRRKRRAEAQAHAEASAPGRGSRARAPKRVATYRENPTSETEIRKVRTAVEAEIEQSGMSGDCETESEIWAKHLRSQGLKVEHHVGVWQSADNIVDHHWLVVDGDLFDPTARQFKALEGVEADEGEYISDHLRSNPSTWEQEGYRIDFSAKRHVNYYETDPRKRHFMIYMVKAFAPDGTLVGVVDFGEENGKLSAGMVDVLDEHQRKGLATAMYLRAEQETGMKVGRPLGGAQTKLGKAFRAAYDARANPPLDGDALAAWCASDESYAVLDATASAGSSWMAGACVLLAKALVATHPEAQLVGLEVDGDVQHVGALVGDVVYDALGAHRERAWARDWLAYEQLDPRTPARLVSLEGVPASVLPDAEAPATARDVRLVARALPA